MTTNPHLDALRSKHRELDQMVQKEVQHPGSSDADITQMKREKLRLKEQINAYETATV